VWLALNTIPGLGSSAFRSLLERFGDPEAVLEADPGELRKVEGVRKEVAQRIAKGEFGCDPVEEMRRVEGCNARLITYADPSYPALLREIHYPPMVLYAKGKDIPPDQSFIAVVGSRNATHYGLKTAERIGMGLARRGVGIVSGLAFGIDAASHVGCLRGRGFAVAVLGTGIDVVYPAANKGLFEQVADQGTLVSEFRMGTPPEPRNFPIRNRIISGLSRGVVVVEATKKSGSLITASFALDQGRDVFAVPGSIESYKSSGTHWLIKQGAKLVETTEDILEEIGHGAAVGEENHRGGRFSGTLIDTDSSEKKIHQVLGPYPVHIDEIVRISQMDPGEVLATLMKMELKGFVKQLPGKMFVREGPNG